MWVVWMCSIPFICQCALCMSLSQIMIIPLHAVHYLHMVALVIIFAVFFWFCTFYVVCYNYIWIVWSPEVCWDLENDVIFILSYHVFSILLKAVLNTCKTGVIDVMLFHNVWYIKKIHYYVPFILCQSDMSSCDWPFKHLLSRMRWRTLRVYLIWTSETNRVLSCPTNCGVLSLQV